MSRMTMIPIKEIITEDGIPLSQCNFVHELIDDKGDIREINTIYLIERLTRERNGIAYEGDRLFHVYSTRTAAVLRAIHDIEIKMETMLQGVENLRKRKENLTADSALNSTNFNKKEEKPAENIGGVRI